MKTHITRLLLISFLLTLSYAVSAQIYVGGSIGGSYSVSESTNSKGWAMDISPEIGYIFNDSWAAGALVSYGKSVKNIDSQYLDETTTNITLFSINPYAIWAPFKFNGFAICAEMGAVLTPEQTGLKYSLWGAYVTPLLTYSLNDHIIFKTGLDFAKLSVSGTTNGSFSAGASVGGDDVIDLSDLSVGLVYKF